MSQRVIVVGGSGRLGQATCRALHAAGAEVHFTYHRAESVAQELSSELAHATALQVDVRDVERLAEAIHQAADGMGGLDALVYAPALGSTQSPPAFDEIAQVSSEGWDELFQVNVKGAFFACQAAARALAESGGNVVLVGSIDGLKCVPSPSPYAASKGALSSLARSLSQEFGKRNVRINAVAPGVLESGVSETLPETLRTDYQAHSCERRLGTHQEIANLLTWLALKNTYVTGETIIVDGGL